MTPSTLLAFSFVALVTIATPGPTVLLAMSNGSRHGLRGAAAGIAGALVSDVILIGAVALGLGALLAASETAFALLKWAGVAYLGWLGIGLLRTRDGGTALPLPAGVVARAPAARLFRRSLLVALGNPKGVLFFSALLPQFVSTTEAQGPQYALLGAVFTLIDLVLMLAYAAAGACAAQRLKASGLRWLNRLCGATLLALAASLAAYRRPAAF